MEPFTSLFLLSWSSSWWEKTMNESRKTGWRLELNFPFLAKNNLASAWELWIMNTHGWDMLTRGADKWVLDEPSRGWRASCWHLFCSPCTTPARIQASRRVLCFCCMPFPDLKITTSDFLGHTLYQQQTKNSWSTTRTQKSEHAGKKLRVRARNQNKNKSKEWKPCIITGFTGF